MAKKKKTSYEEWLKQNDSGVVRTADAVVTTMRGVQNAVQNATQRSRLNKYNTPGFNPYENYSTAVQYGKDLQSMYDSYRGRNLLVDSLKAGQNPLDAYRQESRLKNAITRHNTYMDGIADEAAFNEQIAYPMRYSGLTSAAGVNARLKGMQQTISGFRQSGQTEKANAMQAEYDWLSQRQYDYWTEDDYKKNIAYLEGEIGKQEDRMSNGGQFVRTPFGFVAVNEYAGTDLTEDEYRNLQQQQASNARELSRLENLKTQLSNLQATKEQNAYRDVMKDWSEQDFARMEELARLVGKSSDVRNSGNAAQLMTPGANNPWLSVRTNEEANADNPRIKELNDYFRKKGYSDEEIAALTNYFLREQHAIENERLVKDLTEWSGKNIGTKALGAAMSVPLSLASGIGYADIALQNATAKTDPFTGGRQRVDPYSPLTAISDASYALREGMSKNFGKTGKTIYNAFMSFVDSQAAMMTGGWLGEALLGGSAALSMTRDAYARGATDMQALAEGFFAGLAEAAFEHISLDKLRIMKTGSAAARKTAKEFAVDLLKQMGVEASEEGATDIANLITDYIIMGDKSEINASIRDLMANDPNMSEEEAEKQAWAKWFGQLGEDMIAGALSGGFGTVANTGIGTFQRNAGYVSEGRKILDAGNASTLKELGAALPEGSYGRGLAENVNADGTGIKTARQLGAIASELNQNTLRQGVQSRLEQLGVANASETATAIMRELNGQTTTKAQDQLLKSKAAQRVLTEFRSAAEGSTNYTNEWAYDALYENAERGRNLRTNDEAVKEVAEFAKDYGRHEEAVNKLFKLNSDIPVESFKTGFDAAYTMGKNGVDMEQAMTATATQRMSETQRALAWEIGRSAANNTTTEEGVKVDGEEGSISVPGGGERYDGARAEESVGKLAEGAEPAKGDGQVLSRSAKDSGAADLAYEVNPVSTADFGIAGGTQNKSIYRVSENQKLTPAVQAAVDTAKANGRNIVLFGGGNLEVRDGDAIASVRGMYDPNTNTMYVRVDHEKYTAEQIAKHENGHGLIAEGRITAKEVQDYMKRTMDEEAVEQALADYADAYDGIQMTDEDLWHEIICDALGSMNIFEGIDVFSEQAERAEQRGEAIRNAAAEMQKGRAPPEDNVEQKFSMETPIEETRTLVALHNLDEDNLRRTLKLGAFPSPSIAIVKAEQGHSKYGPISAVFPRSTIDPEADRRNKVYGGDAWTPTHRNARVEYPVDVDRAVAFEERIGALSKTIANGAFSTSSILRAHGVNNETDMTASEIADRLARDDAVRAAYLADTGKAFEPEYAEKQFDRKFGNEAVEKAADRIGEERIDEIVEALDNGADGKEAIGAEMQTIRQIFFEYYADLARGFSEKIGRKRGMTPAEIEAHISKRAEHSLEDVSIFTYEDFVKNVWLYVHSEEKTGTEIDRLATQDKLKKVAPDADVKQWLISEMDGLLGEPGIYNGKDYYTSSGNRRSFKQLHWEYTAENIVRAMNNASSRGENYFGFGASGMHAVATTDFRNVQQMHAEEGRLRAEDAEAYKEKFETLDATIQKCVAAVRRTNKAHSDNSFEEQEIIGSVMMEAAQSTRTVKGVQSTFRKEGYTISDETAKQILAMYKEAADIPTEYFEAKPQRVVGFDEVAALVVPDNIDVTLKRDAESAGMDVLTYKAGDEADRLRVVNSVEGAKFSRDLSALDSDYMAAVDNGDMETAQRMVEQAAQRWGAYSKNGKTPVVLYHGTDSNFTEFKSGKIGKRGKPFYGRGFYFSDKKSDAENYGSKIMPVYVRFDNPLILSGDDWAYSLGLAEKSKKKVIKTSVEEARKGFYTLHYVLEDQPDKWLYLDNVTKQQISNDGGKSYVEYKINQISVLPRDVSNLSELARSRGFDAIIGEGTNVGDIGDEYVVFEPEQIKSADPITYDDDGNVIPLSERFNPENADIRYSRDLENLDELRRENDRLRKRLDEAKQQTKLTTEPTLREGDVRKAARGMLKEMDSTLTVDDIADDMKALGEYMMRGESKRERAPSWEEVKRRASEIAERIVDNASALSEASDVELYKELRKYLRTTKLTLAETDRADMQDGYAEFVKRNFNRIKLGNEGLPVDSAYQELQEMYGKGLFPDDITHPADQLMHIEDVLNGLRPVYENPHSFHRQEAVAWAANAVIDTLLSEDVRQTAPTFADKAEARREKDVAEAVAWERYKGEQREDRLKERYAKRMKDALQKAKERRARDIDRLVLKQKFKESARKERSARTALWNKILDLKKDFRRMVEKPQQADSKHAPLRLARALDGVTSCFSVENRERILPISELDRALGKLRDVYKLAEKDDELALYYDEGLIDNIDAVRTMLNEVDPFDATLDSQKLQKVYDLLKMCKHNVTTANQFVSRNWAKTIIEAGRKWAAEIASASIIFKKGFAAQLLNYQLRPDSMFARFSGFAKNSVGEQIQEMFVDGEEKMLRIQQDFYYAFERFSKSKEFDKLTRHGKASLVDVGLKDENGNAIKLTRDQMLALYMNLRSEDNILALAYGGADIPGVSTYYTGKVAKSFDDSVRTVSIDANVFKLIDEARNLADEAQGENVTDERRQEIQQRLDELQSEVKALEQEAFTNLFGVKAKIEKQLTKFEKDLVEAADEWMLKSKDYINAETKAMYGIEKAQVEHYWPIHRNMNFVNTDMRTAVNEINLENWGSLKERVKSHAPIKLTGFIFELDNHTKKMSQFCGFAAAQRDFNKLYQTRMPYQHSTLKEQIAKKFGSDSGLIGVSGMEYIDNYIAAVSGGGDATKPSVLAWARRNLPRATLSANIRVALSQVASVPTAAAEVGWGAMAKGFARYSLKGFSGKQIEALAKADPWFWQRSRGEGGMREFAEMKESTFALDRGYNKIAGTKVGKALLNWCQKFDMYATYTQWAMAEEWVKQNRKDLKKGSEAFDEAVSRKYRDILRRTQPNYTVTERSDLLRDKRESMKWATMYKTQSNQNLNILYDATARLRQYTRDFKNGKNGVTQQDVADARRQFARAYSGVILGGTVTFVLFRAFANALLHAMNAYRDDDDKELTLESFLEGLGEETLGAISGMFLFGSEIEEFVFAAVTHGKYWGLSDSAISAISDVVKNLYNLTQDPSEEKILKFVNSLAAPLGLPISNVKKIVDGIGYHIEDIRNGEFLSFDAGVNRTAQQQASRFAKAMEDGDTAKMKRIYDEMVASSEAKDPEANTQEALRGQIKDAFIGTDGKATLSESEALKLLEKFGGKTGDEAKDILNKWKFEKEFGYEYKELGDRYIAGELSDSEYKNALMNYGGKSEEDADEIVGKKKLVREYGFEYSEDNIVDAAIAGDITADEAYDIWTNYGGVNDREAENRATRLQFVVDNPGIAYDDAKIGMVTDYDEYVAAAKGANIKPLSAEDFSEYWLAADALSSDYDANGNPIKGSERKDKVFAYIASLDIPAEQKTAIALSMYAAKTVSKMKTW